MPPRPFNQLKRREFIGRTGDHRLQRLAGTLGSEGFQQRCRASGRCPPSCPAWAPDSPRHRSGRSRPSPYRRRSPLTPSPRSPTPAPSNVAQSASAFSPPESRDARCITTKREKPLQPARRITIATAGLLVSRKGSYRVIDDEQNEFLLERKPRDRNAAITCPLGGASGFSRSEAITDDRPTCPPQYCSRARASGPAYAPRRTGSAHPRASPASCATRKE